ncbi:MAG: hypothetical protein WAO18_08500 [Mycobacterium sp.]
MAQKDVFTLVKKSGICQYNQSAESDQRGGVTNEIDLALAEIRDLTAR